MQFKHASSPGTAQPALDAADFLSAEPCAVRDDEADEGSKWQAVSRIALVLWLSFYMLFLLYAAFDRTGFLLIDYVNLPIHEGGHLLFKTFTRCGQEEGFAATLAVAGGTILQLAVPLLLAVCFAYQRHPTGTAFCSFFFFENFLNISTYMADARRQQLTLVTVGDGDNVIHDWLYLFSHMHVLQHDLQIAAAVRFIGWIGMIGTVLWLIRKRDSRLDTSEARARFTRYQ